jgi:PilZ domain
MGDGAERREARRFTMTLPLRVFPSESKGPELNARTRDVSYRGLYFLADAKFEVGSEIEFVITLPEQITQSGEVSIHCHGQVVRVEASDNGNMGVAAKIERYEFLHAAA